MRVAFSGLLLGLLAASLTSTTPLPAQETPDTFRWIDFHSPKDQDVVVWVNKALEAEKWTAIREMGVEYDAALVVTAERASPQANPNADKFAVFSVSLTNHSVNALIKGVNLRVLDWMLFAVGQRRELGVMYDDCIECNASTYFTSFYYDEKQHQWAARWLRGAQGIPLATSIAPQGVTVSQAYAAVADPNGHEVIATWSHFDYGKQKPAEDYVYAYDVDPWNGLDRTQLISNKEVVPMEKRICQATGSVAGLAKGQDSEVCRDLLQPEAGHKARKK